MENGVTRLYPPPAEAQVLEGLYLAHDVRRYGEIRGRPYVYTNFVTSLDGRIAVPRRDSGRISVPRDVANPRDWRLFQELAAQADVLITSGRYMREWAKGNVQEILQVDKARFADLKAWRAAQGLAPQADIAILSLSLQFPIPDVLCRGERRTTVYTMANPDPERVKALEAQGLMVVAAGKRERVEARQMVAHMAEQGYRLIYSTAGPEIMHMLLAGRVVDRLYLTFANRILASEIFATMVQGPRLEPPVGFKLNTLYHDAVGLEGLGQLFASYDVVPEQPAVEAGGQGEDAGSPPGH